MGVEEFDKFGEVGKRTSEPVDVVSIAYLPVE